MPQKEFWLFFFHIDRKRLDQIAQRKKEQYKIYKFRKKKEKQKYNKQTECLQADYCLSWDEYDDCTHFPL